MASLRPCLHHSYRFLLRLKNSTLCIIWSLIFLSAFQAPTLAETTVYLTNSTYTVFDDNVSSNKPNCFSVFSISKKVTFYNVNNKNDCLNSTAILSDTLPKFSDKLSDQTYRIKNSFFEALVLLCWSDIVSFMFFCLVLFLFSQVLPG